MSDNAAGLHVLFVDDEVENTSIMKRTLRRYHTIYVANSGRSALELMASQHIDVVFADQRMPEMTGVEFLERCRDLYPETYRVLLTGYTDITALVNAINRCELDSYLSKPWTKETLLEQIDRAVERRARVAEQPHRPLPGTPLDILVADDEPENLNLLERVLGRTHRLYRASNGRESLEVLAKHHIDLAIVDQRMPEMAGSTFLERSKLLAPDLIKIMITAYSDVEVIIEAINNAKVHKFLYKPYDPKHLREVIDQLLARR